MSLDKITPEAVTALSGTGGFFGVVLYWFSVRWRLINLKEDVNELKNTTRKIETCNQMNKNLCHSLASIEQSQREIVTDIKQLLIRVGQKWR